jgi:hypothetical protein
MNVDWIGTIDGQNFLAILDVAIDIETELNISPDRTVIPLWQGVIKFPQLFPGDSIGMRDRYCDMRYKAVAFLQRNGVIKQFQVHQQGHRWYTKIEVELVENDFREAVRLLREEWKRRRGDLQSEDSTVDASEHAMESLLTIFGRFHAVTTELRRRHDDRATLDVTDEYDVQDLLRALLVLFFDDVRREEWTPSYAGKASRCDFLLKTHGIVVEVKKTRSGLTDKEIGDQLIIDIARYRQMPGCKRLVCFVYDPEDRVTNRAGFEGDLTRSGSDFAVDVFVFPRR